MIKSKDKKDNNTIREEKEQNEIKEITASQFETYYHDYHFFYVN